MVGKLFLLLELLGQVYSSPGSNTQYVLLEVPLL